MKLLIKKFKPFVPDVFTIKGDSGYDIRAAIKRPLVIRPHGLVKIPTGIGVEIKYWNFRLFRRYLGRHFELQVRPRSGFTGDGIISQYGTIDESYRGEISIHLYNANDHAVRIEPLARIAQLVIVPVYKLKIKHTNVLSETERGANGFGSTGKE